MAASIVSRLSTPLGEINTTPLIDVLLVLLVMLVITTPVSTNTLPIDLPQCTDNCGAVPLSPERNRLVLARDDTLLWNGTAITRTELADLLSRSRALPVEPEPQFAPEADAGYDAAARTIKIIKASGVTKFGFVGNERFHAFGR